MSNISVRLPDDVLRQLQEEARVTRKKRSELIREAVVDYLERSERDRFLEEMVAEARAGYGDPGTREEALRIDEDFSALDEEPDDDNEQWWK